MRLTTEQKKRLEHRLKTLRKLLEPKGIAAMLSEDQTRVLIIHKESGTHLMSRPTTDFL